MTELADQLARVFALLKQTQPDPDEYDVVWRGPHYIPRPQDWRPPRFMLYRGTLYVSLFAGYSWHGLTWTLGSDQVDEDRELRLGSSWLDEATWLAALEQIERRLAAALSNFAAYNRRVERLLPLACRTGKIQRGLTWPMDEPPAISPREVQRGADAVAWAGQLPLLAEMMLTTYLEAAGVAYDAAFDDLRTLSLPEKYRRRADGRHDGLLDLPPDDPDAFASWFADTSTRTGHPWEIVFGHPHGIMLNVRRHDGTGRWSYSLAVDSMGYYVEAARMAIALADHGIPFEFYRWDEVADALLGRDDVQIGHGLRSLSYEELCERRPDSAESVRWDPVPHLGPITPDQLVRVERMSQPDGVP